MACESALPDDSLDENVEKRGVGLATNLATYVVAFDEGPMGINLEDGAKHDTIGAVLRATKGQAKTSGQVRVGDIVYKVNTTDLLGVPYSKVMEMLRSTPSPKTLEFVPKDQLAVWQQLTVEQSAFQSEQSVSVKTDQEWEEENLDENLKALKAIRRCMPVNIKNMSEAELQTTTSPNGKIMPRDMARKFKRTNVLELLRMDPKDIMKSHPSLLENLRVTGLTVTERRALHAHLRDIGESWKAGQNEELTKRKFEWFRTLKETFKTVVNAYNRHVAQFGPADNHPYATFGDGGIGCPLLGRQCPIMADMAPAYSIDLGHPDGDVYGTRQLEQNVYGGVHVDGFNEVELEPVKRANARVDILKKHYKNIRLAAEAYAACELIDRALEMLETRQKSVFETRLCHKENKTETVATIALEIREFADIVSELRLHMQKLVERAGFVLKNGKTSVEDETNPDTRSSVECALAVALCSSSDDCVSGIEERLEELREYVRRGMLQPEIAFVKMLTKHLKGRSVTTLSVLGKPSEAANCPYQAKTRAELLELAKEKVRSDQNLEITAQSSDDATQPAPAGEITTSRTLVSSSGGILSWGGGTVAALKIRTCDVVTARSALLASFKAIHQEKSHGEAKRRREDSRWQVRLLRLLKRLWRAMTRRLKQ